MITAKQATLFGLTSQEKKIINLLLGSTVGLNATVISSRVSEPRTTVNFYMNKLLDKGWVKKIKSVTSPYPLWRLNDKSNLKNIILELFTLIGITPTIPITITAKEGYEHIKNAYEKILEVGNAERVFIIQGNRTSFAAIKKLQPEFIEKIHTIQKQKPIILEGIISKKGLSVFNIMTLRELQSHYGRLTVAYLIPDEYLDFDAEIFIFQNSIVIIQPIAGKSLIIQDENTAQALKMLVEFMEQHAKKIDINSYIKELIKKTDKN